MPNPRLLQTAERWMNKEAPIIKSNAGVRDPQPQNSPIAVGFPDNVGSSFLFSYDGAHKDFAQELIAKNNELFSGTQAKALYQEISKHRQDLGLSKSDLEKKLIIVNSGIKRMDGMPYGVCPIILPGLTQVYTHEVLDKVGEDFNFEGYGLKGGLPIVKQLEKGDRTLYMPSETQDIGLRVLFRYGGLDLNARDWDLAGSYGAGRVSFAPQGRSPKK